MTTLGQAYVQIMPSAKGISGSIQKTLDPEATRAGKSAGSSIASSIANSMGKAGKTLTKAITVPAMGAATAVAGLVGALGFKRLVGMDVAQAKLKGLGIEGKQLEIVMENAKDAVTGTTHTMADGVNVAAGALASGVKEGADLERYIKLVGDAATGASAPMGEMAQIFNRVQGTGKLMTMELNQIEHRMPGFSQALAKHLDVPPEKMREMVTAGKVTSEDFLNVMENYAGGMSAAYAETWSGLKDNVLSNIGIIGEALLEGLFEDGKKGMAEFLDFLRNSEGLKEWATETGEKIREVFNTVVETVKNAIQWWTSLSDSTKKMIMIVAGIVLAIGPVLMVISKLITTAITLSKGFGLLKVAAGAISTAIGAISTPVLVVIGVIAGLIALFTTLYKTNEGFKDLVNNVWETIKETISTVIQTISDFVMEIWGGLVDWWNENSEMILQAAQNVWNFISTIVTTVMNVIWGIMQALWPIIKMLIISTWEAIKGAIQGAISVITGIIQFFSALFTGNWSALWDSVKQILSGAVQLVWNIVQLWFVGKILKIGKTFFNLFKGVFSAGWNFIKSLFSNALKSIVGRVRTEFNGMKTIVNIVMSYIRGFISSIWSGIRNTISNVVNSIRNVIRNIFNSLKGIVSSAFNGVKSAVSNGMRNAFNAVKNFFGRFKDAGRRIVTSIADGIKGAIGVVTGAIGNVASKIRNFLPFSPPKEGPLMDIMDVKWGETIAGGIEKGESAVAKAMEDMLDFDLTQKVQFNNPRNNTSNRNDFMTSQQNQPIILQVDGKTFAQIMGPYTSQEGGNRIRKIERGLA